MNQMQLSQTDLNLLVVLDALLQTRSVKQAARRIGLSPSATSHALARLRQLLSDPLLVRAGRQLVPTPRAEHLRPALQQLLHDLGQLISVAERPEPTQLRRTFRIAATDYAEMIVVRPLSDALATRAPGVSLHSQAPTAELVERLRADEVEFAIGVFPPQPVDIRRAPLLRERFVCLLRQGHPALRRKLTLQRYAQLGHVLVVPRGEPRGIVDVYLERQGFERRVVRTVASFHAAPAIVERTDFIVTLPAQLAERLAPTLGLVARQPPIDLPGFDVELLWHRRHDTDLVHGWLRQEIVSVARELG